MTTTALQTKSYNDFTQFNGLDMLKIDIANTYGLDKAVWAERINWVDQNIDDILIDLGIRGLKTYMSQAEEPLLFKKAVLAYKKAVIDKQPISHNMFMDATASGIQIMAALSGCHKTAKAVNLIYTGKREDIYSYVSNKLIERFGHNPLFERANIKKPIMTHYYNSKAKPKEILGEGSELEAFYEILADEFTGAEAVMHVINQAWNPAAEEHSWTLPDGHRCVVKVTETKDIRIEADELGITFNYRMEFQQPSENSRSLAPNVIHSIDAYIAREIVRRANFQVAHIHDAFTCHPNHMPKVMELYREILAEIAESDLLSQIISEITGVEIKLNKFSYDLHKYIREAQYCLS